jgi:hypothetical protein
MKNAAFSFDFQGRVQEKKRLHSTTELCQGKGDKRSYAVFRAERTTSGYTLHASRRRSTPSGFVICKSRYGT